MSALAPQLHAARVLASSGAAAERVAAHLLAARPAGDRWAIDMLSEAARDALSRGAPESAVAYLKRALADAPAGDDRQRVVALLGRSEYLAYQPGASAHLIEAMDAASTAEDRGELALQAAKAMIMRDPDRSEAAIELLDRAIGELAEPESQLSMRLEAQLLAGAGLKLSTRRVQAERMNGVYSHATKRRARRSAAAGQPRPIGRCWRGARRADSTISRRHAGAAGTPAEVACRVAERALAGGRLLREEGPDSQLFYLASWTLWIADRFDRSEYWLGQALEDARERGSVLGYGIASASQAEVAYRRGDLTLAEAHARAAADTSPEDAAAALVDDSPGAGPPRRGRPHTRPLSHPARRRSPPVAAHPCRPRASANRSRPSPGSHDRPTHLRHAGSKRGRSRTRVSSPGARAPPSRSTTQASTNAPASWQRKR